MSFKLLIVVLFSLQTNEVITLSSSTDAEAAGVLGQCLSVDWAPTDGHTRIVGGFARGAVAIWDLTSQSPLVLMQSPIGNHNYPYIPEEMNLCLRE